MHRRRWVTKNKRTRAPLSTQGECERKKGWQDTRAGRPAHSKEARGSCPRTRAPPEEKVDARNAALKPSIPSPHPPQSSYTRHSSASGLESQKFSRTASAATDRAASSASLSWKTADAADVAPAATLSQAALISALLAPAFSSFSAASRAERTSAAV